MPKVNPIMPSRIFLQTAITLGAVMGLVLNPCRASAADDSRQYYELRVYATKSAEQQQRVNDYWQAAAVPGCNRAGIQPVGFFPDSQGSPTNPHSFVRPLCSLA